MNLNEKYKDIFVFRGTKKNNTMKTVEVLRELCTGVYLFEHGKLIKSFETIT